MSREPAGAARSGPRRGGTQRPWWARAWALQLGLIALLAAASFVLWTDLQVRTRMEGRLWALPARLYARPLELHAGAPVTAQRLVAELERLGYRETPGVERPGQYRVLSDAVALHTRGFVFGDGAEPARRVRVAFEGRQVKALRAAEGAALALVRLEPVELGRIHPGEQQDRVLVALAQVPPVLVEAMLAIEDRHFLRHPGLDLRGILRAAWRNLRAGAIQEGGSTITQQLVKNLFLGAERTFTRKLHEALIALVIEFRYDKTQILEAWLNEIYLGQQGERAVHGVGRAAGFYFGRPVEELTLPEAALLAGLVRGASMYDPRRFPERALARRNQVIDAMRQTGAVDEAAATAARAAPLGLSAQPAAAQRHPAFFDLVRRQLAADYRAEDLAAAGLQVFTTLDPALQAAAETALAEGVAALEARVGGASPLQAAAVLTAPDTGEVLALVGDRDPRYPGFNRALDARRPVGSLAKPFVYLAALASGRYDVASRVDDAPVDWREPGGQRWQPRNYDGKVHGQVGFEQALAQSYNLAAVRLALELGIPAVKRTLRAAGLQGEVPDYPSIALGSLEASPLEMAQAYGSIASGGAVFAPRAVREVLTREGRPLGRWGLQLRQTIDPRAAFLTTWLLTRVVETGTARSLGAALPASLPLAGKTGTTDELRDSWYAGFGADWLGVVWLGRDDNSPAGLSGAAGALDLWTRLARAAPPLPLALQAPPGVEWVWTTADGRARAGTGCAGARRLPFLRGGAPAARGDCGLAERGPDAASSAPAVVAPAAPTAGQPRHPVAPQPRAAAPEPGFRAGGRPP